MKRYGFFVVLAGLATTFCSVCPAQDADYENEVYERVNMVIVECVGIASHDKNEAIKTLSFCLLRLGAENSTPPVAHQRELYLKCQAALLAIPGHAEYHLKRINFARGKGEAVEELRPGHGFDSILSDSDFADISSFETLIRLPSPETVSVMGQFLNDAEKTSERLMFRHFPGATGPLPYGHLAAVALGEMIENPPVAMGTDFVYSRDIDFWRLWFEEVKVGSRPFRFKGDRREYTLAGIQLPTASLQRIERDTRRNEERLAGLRRSSSVFDSKSLITQISKPSSIAAILAACALVAAAVWHFLRGRRAV